jgi:hypothetical protein
MNSTIFWDITPCSPSSLNRRFGGTYRLHLQDWKNKLSKQPVRKPFIFTTQKMETICSSETSVNTQRSTWSYIPEDGNLRCSNLTFIYSSWCWHAYKPTNSFTLHAPGCIIYILLHYYLHVYENLYVGPQKAGMNGRCFMCVFLHDIEQ